MVSLNAELEPPDVACSHPSKHGSHRRVLGTGSRMPRSIQLGLSQRPCSQRVHVGEDLTRLFDVR
ncbi:Uncharacterised protein [Vibrio cholerae]|nr:Uncharacterised protein [Vibrio cholerae]CSD30382.1 Uncharacterised protein [Vibrio cholerae]CSI23784.1 Uncharacterised protein [Vibrio cholerae]CSI45631.1 Uncharacterised protein [Vibrio cholerae]